MSIHGLIDTLAVGLGSKFMSKYFRDGVESPSIEEYLKTENFQITFPEITGEGDYELSANTLVGELNAAFIKNKKYQRTCCW